MNKYLICTIVLLCFLAGSASAGMSESFEDIEIGKMPPPAWLKWEEAGGRGWSNSWAGRQPMPGWMSGTNSCPPGGGSRMAYVTYTHGGSKTNDLWLITPTLKGITATSTVSFWQNNCFTNFADNLRLWISTNPAAYRKSQFSMKAWELNMPRGQVPGYVPPGTGDFGAWTKVTVNIGTQVTAGTDIRLGFQEYYYNNWYDVRAIELDLIESDLWSAPILTTTAVRAYGDVIELDCNIFPGYPAGTMGVCWGTGPDPEAMDAGGMEWNKGYHTITNRGAVTAVLSNMNAGSKWYVRPYVQHSKGTYYGNQMVVYPGGAGGEGALFESFETTPVGQMPPLGWSKWQEAGGRGWSNSYAGRQPMPGWMSGTNSTPPGGGERMAYVTYTHGGSKTNDLWLISPTIENVPPDCQLSFWQNNCFTNFADNLYVYISEDTDAYRTTDFTNQMWHLAMARGQVPGYVPPGIGDFGGWSNPVINVTDYVEPGSDVRIAFREYYYNNWYDVRASQLDLIEMGNTNVRYGLRFDGTDDCAVLPVTNQPTAFTIEAWVRPLDIKAQTILTRSTDNPSTAYNEMLVMNGSGQFVFYNYDGAAKTITGTTTAQTGRWYHVAGTAQKDGTMRLYVNGVEEGTALSIGTLQTGMTNIYVGAESSLGTYDFFEGDLDEIRVWNDVRTVTELNENMCRYLRGMEDGLLACYRLDSTWGRDLFDSTQRSTYNAWFGPDDESYSWTHEKKYYDGVDDYTFIPDTNRYADYTVEAWVYPKDTSAQNILAFSDGDPLTSYMQQLRINSSGNFQFYSYDGTVRTVTSADVLTPKQWYYVVGTAKNGSDMKLFVNGVEKGFTSAGNTLWGSGYLGYYVGANSALGNYPWFEGRIGDTAYTNTAKTDVDILAAYNAHATGAASSTWPAWTNTATPIGNAAIAATTNTRAIWSSSTTNIPANKGLNLKLDGGDNGTSVIFGDNNLSGITASNLSSPLASRMQREWTLFVQGASSLPLDFTFSTTDAGAPEMGHPSLEGFTSLYHLIWRTNETSTFATKVASADSASSGVIIFSNCNASSGYYTLALRAPDAPAPQAATNITAHTFHANWSAVATATNYYIDVASDSGFSAWVDGFNNRLLGDAQTCLVTGLTEGTPYYYRLRAEHASAVSTNSGTINPTTLTEGSIGGTPLSIGTTYNTNKLQTGVITNTGETAFSFTSSITYGAGASGWLTIAPANGTISATDSITITSDVNVAGINVGTYYATNTITSATATNSPVTQSIELTIAKSDQSINFPAISTQLTTNTVNLAATTSSGLPVSFSVGGGPASISGGTNVTFTTSGTVEIIATQAGNGNYNAASAVTNSFTVNKSPQAGITFTPTTPQTYNTTNALSASGGSGGGAFSYAIVSGPGLIVDTTNLKATSGIDTIAVRATKASDAMYLAHSTTASVACAKAAQTITFPAISDTLTTNTVNLAATSDSGLSVSFAIGSGSASISGGTNVTFAASGPVSIIASQAGNNDYAAAPAVTNTFNANKSPQSLPLSFIPTTPQVYNTTNTVAASGGSGTGVFTYAVSSGPGLIVDSTKLKATSGINTIDVVATKGADDMYLSQSITSSVSCAKAEQTITFPGISTQLTTNTVNLAATASSELAVSFAIGSGPASIASGTNVTFSTSGSVEVIASQAGDNNFNAAPPTTNTFTVNKTAQGTLTFTPTSPQVYHTTNALSTSGGSGTGEVSYAVTAGAGQIVNTTDLTITAGTGTVTVVASKATDDMFLATASTSLVTCAKAEQTITFPAISTQLTTNTVNLAATASSELAVSFAVGSGPASIASGTNVTFSTSGSVDIVASQTGDDNFNAAPSVTNTFAVSKSPQSLPLSFIPTTPQVYNTTNTVAASGGSGTGVFTYAVSSGPGLIVDSTKLKATSGINTIDVVATKGSDDMYLSQSITSSVSCAKAEQTITFPGISTQLTTNTVNLAATASSELTVSFAIGSGPASIAGGTNVTFSTSGSVEIIASQAGDNNFNAAPSTTNTFTVNKTPQAALVFSPTTPQVYHTTNALSTSSGSGTGEVSYAVTAGAGQIVNTTDLTITAGTGTVTVVASKATDDMFLATASTSSVTCAKAEQTITFPAISTQLTTNTVNLAATASSELTVSFAIGSGPASISGGTNVTFTTSGSVDIVASQTGDDNFNAAPSLTNTFTVNKTPQASLYFVPITPQVYNTTNTVVASGGSGTGIFSYAVSSGPGQIIGTDELKATSGINTIDVIATKATDDMYLVSSITSSVACAKAEQTVTFPPISDQLTTNSIYLAASASSELGISFAVASGSASIASGSNLTFTASGSVTITANQTGDSNYNPAPETTNTFIANKSPQETLIFTPTTPQTYHTTNALTTSGGSGTGTVTYAVASGAGQIVNSTDLTITAGTGTVTVVATKAIDDMFLSTAATSTVTAIKENQTISFSALPDTFWTNTVYLSATASSELSVSFNVVSGPASISGNTNLTFTGIGSVSIRASQAGDDNFEAAPSVTNTFNTLGPQFELLGTNALIITNNAVADATSGTDFGNVLMGFNAITNTFSITNSGTAVMTLLDLTTNGLNATSFEISNLTSAIPAGASTSFRITFNPVSGMVNNASFIFDYDGTNTPYTLNVTGYGQGGGITLATNNLAFTASYVGANPANQTLILTNTGVSPFTFTNTLTYGTNATGWLTITPSDTTIALNGTTTFTNTIEATNLSVGIYYATNTITALDATNSPQTFVIQLEIIKADQTITFPAISDQITTNTPAVTATALSGLPVSLTVTSGPAILLSPFSPSSLSFSTSGQVTIVASQAGDSNWNPAPSTTNIFNVTKTPQAALIFTPSTPQVYHITNTLTTSGGSGTGAVTYAVASGAGQIVNSTDLTITAGTGTVVVVATKATDDMYLSTATTSTVTAIRENQTISFSALSDTFWTNTVHLSATASSELSVSFNVVSGPASISANTNLTFTGIGAVSIRASQAGDDNFEAAPSVTNTFNTLGPQFELLGTNALIITNNAVADATSGTDFGNVLMGFNAITNTFTITNSGTAVMTLLDVVTNGLNATSFEISNLTSEIPAGASTSFDITFNPVSGMVNNAAFVFDYDGTNSPYTLNVTGYGQGGGITLATNNLAFTASYVGANPANQTLLLTNTGVSPFTFTNTLTYGTNATGWLTITPSDTTIALNGTTTFTNTIEATNLSVGIYYATNTITALDATNSPQTFVIQLEIIKADQTITFPAISDQITTNTPAVTATALSGLPVSLTVTSGPAILLSPFSPSSLSFSTSGQVTIVASQAGDSNWNPAPSTTNTFNVTKTPQAALIFTPSTPQVYHTTNALSTSGGSGTGIVTYVVASGAGQIVNSTDLTITAGTGTVTVVATKATDDMYLNTATTSTVTAIKENQTISFSALPDTFWSNTVHLSATASSELTVLFDIVSGPASISANTNVTFTGVDQIKIRASQAGDNNYNAAPSVTNTFNTLGPQLGLFGTNALAITNNAATTTENGTDFGKVLMGFDAITNTFTITNSGTAVMTFLDLTTNGTGAASFELSNLTSEIPAGVTTTFDVIFNPVYGMANKASFVFDYDGPNAPFSFNVTGYGQGGGITLATNEVAFTATYVGANPASQTLVLTNTGVSPFTFTNSITYGTNATGWLTINPSDATVALNGDTVFTNSINITNLNVGTYYATNIITALDATNSPQEFVIQLEIIKADQTINFPAIPNQVTTNTPAVTATALSGLPVSLAVTSGPAVLLSPFSPSSLSFSTSGQVAIVASQGGNHNWNPAPPVTNTLKVTKAVGSLTFSNLNQTYNGTPRTVSVSSVPSVSSVLLTYNGTSTAPTNAGSYTIIATTDDLIYQGSITDTLVVVKSSQTISFPAIADQLTTNTPVITATAASELPIAFEIISGPASLSTPLSPSRLAFSTEGTVLVRASQTGDLNWVATSVTNSISINKSPQQRLSFTPASPQAYLTTNTLSTTGGSGTGSVSYAILSGPGEVQNLTQLYISSGSGIVHIAATKASDSMFNAETVTSAVYSTHAEQFITFPPIPNQFITNSYVLNAYSKSSLPITYAIHSGPGVLNQSNLTFSATGHVVVTATQRGSTNWNPSATATNILRVYPILPRVTTEPIKFVDQSTTEAGGVVTYNGGAPITQRGICWSTNYEPTTADFLTYDGTGDGLYGSIARGLDAATTYRLRSYAINEVGTSYGNIIAVTTSNLPPPPPPVTYTWSGTTSTRWDDTNNWGGFVVPISSNNAIFYETNAINLRINLDGPHSVQSLIVRSNATQAITLQNGSILLTNTAASIQIVTGSLHLADALITSSLTITNEGILQFANGILASGSIHKSGTGPAGIYGYSSINSNAIIQQGQLRAAGTISLGSSNPLVIASSAILSPRGQEETATQLTITNTTPDSVALVLNGILTIGIFSNTIDTIQLADNQLQLGSNSVLDIDVVAGDLNITSVYTLATATAIHGQFAQVNGLTAHTLSISSNAITLNPSFVWDGTHATNWSQAQSWTNASTAIPSSENDTGFCASSTNTITVNVDTNPTVRSIRATGRSTIILDGPAHTITLTNRDVAAGNSPAISAQDGADFIVRCGIQTVPGARITSMQTTNRTMIRIAGNLTGSPGAGNLILDGSGSIELLGTNTFGTSTNGLEIRSAQVYVGSEMSLGAPGASIMLTNSGTLNITNSMRLARPIQLAGNGNIGVPDPANTLVFTNRITGGGRLALRGSGTIVLDNIVETHGADIQCGLLSLQGSLSGTDDINVHAPASLGGNGSVSLQSSYHILHIQNGAYCSPGNSIGTITVDGSMTIDGTLSIEIENNLNDTIKVRDTLSLNPGSALQLIGMPDGNSSYVLATYASRYGYFSNVNLPVNYLINYTSTNITLVPGSGAELGKTNILREGSTVNIPLTISSNTAWTAISTSSWVNVTSGANGRGPGTIQLTIHSNQQLARSTTVWIAGMEFVIRQQANRAVPLDYDGDGKADVAVYWPDEGYWYILQSHDMSGHVNLWGWDQAFCEPGDYDGDSINDIAVYYPDGGIWNIIYSSDNSTHSFNWGWSATKGVPADYDGDGITDIAVYSSDNGTWYIWESGHQSSKTYTWGWGGALPVPADYDGDGKTDPAVYAPENGMWYIWLTKTQTARIQAWGWNGVQPVPSDYDGDDKSDIGIYWSSAGSWNILLSGNTNMLQHNWGWSQASAVPADYDGDGITDFTVYCNEKGMWYIWQSATQTSRTQPWGWNGAESTQ